MEINLEELRKHHLVVAAPMYGGNATSVFNLSLVNLFYNAGLENLKVGFLTLWNDALITRARNTLVKKFLKETDADIFLFIDSDIQFNWQNILEMMQIMIDSDDKKIICGVYPKKSINWKSVNKAYKLNKVNKAEDAKLYSSDFVLNFKNNNKTVTTFNLNEPVAVQESGTGFMMIHREVFEKFAEVYPEQNTFDPDSKSDLFYYFDCKIDPKTNIYLSEDWMFCQWAAKIGYDTWVLPWIHLGHMGSYIYEGSFSAHSEFNYELMQLEEQNKTGE
jgi:hypothetical protein